MLQVHLGMGQKGAAGAVSWQMGEQAGAEGDDGGFMETSPLSTPADRDSEDTYTAGQPFPAGPAQALLLRQKSLCQDRRLCAAALAHLCFVMRMHYTCTSHMCG